MTPVKTNLIKVAIFDCDGVMFDTQKTNMAYYNRILAHFELPPMTPDQFAYTHMHTVHASLDFLFTDADMRREADRVRQNLNYLSLIRLMEMEPDLEPLLKKLRPGYKTAVATNRSDTMNRVLEEHGLEGYFDMVVSASDVARPKPYPDPLLKILKYFKALPEEAVYVGDSEVDEQAAAGAGIPLIAYNNSSLNAAFHIKRLQEIEGILGV